MTTHEGKRWWQTAAVVGVGIALVVAPWQTGSVAPSMAVLGSMGFLAGWYRLRGAGRLGAGSNVTPLDAAALVPVAQTCSLALSADLSWGIRLTTLSWAGLGVAVLIVGLSERARRWVLWSLLTSAVLCAIYAASATGPMSGHEGGAVVTGRAQGPLAQPNELGSFMQLTLPVALLAAAGLTSSARGPGRWDVAACEIPGVAETKSRRQRRHARSIRLREQCAGVVSVVAVGSALVLSLSRGAWLGAVVGVIVLSVLVPETRRVVSKAVAMLAVIAVAAMLIGSGVAQTFTLRLQSLFAPGESTSDDRPSIWYYALDLAQAHPLLGVGPGGMAAVSGQAYRFDVSFVTPIHAHNLVLTAMAEGGVIAVLTLVAMAYVGARNLADLYRQRARPALSQAVAMAALSGAAVHGLLDFPWRAPVLTFLTWILIGLATPKPALDPVRSAPPIRKRKDQDD